MVRITPGWHRGWFYAAFTLFMVFLNNSDRALGASIGFNGVVASADTPVTTAGSHELTVFGDQAAIRVFFRNPGSQSREFHVKVVSKNNVTLASNAQGRSVVLKPGEFQSKLVIFNLGEEHVQYPKICSRWKSTAAQWSRETCTTYRVNKVSTN